MSVVTQFQCVLHILPVWVCATYFHAYYDDFMENALLTVARWRKYFSDEPLFMTEQHEGSLECWCVFLFLSIQDLFK